MNYRKSEILERKYINIVYYQV